MLYDQPLYHQSPPSPLGKYSTRVLLGLLCSLSVVLLLFHLPLSTSSDHIGWSTRSSTRIPLSQVQHEEETASDSKDASAEEDGSAPPPTRYGPPTSSETPKGLTGESTGEQTDKEESSQSSDEASPPVRSIAALSAEDTQPEIVGGRGSLYLNLTYPPDAQKQGIEGLLVLEFTVGRNGKTRSIEVTSPLHPLCDSAAVRALRSVKFRPATHEGTPIPVRMSLPVRFELRSDPSALPTTSRSSSGG